MPRRIDWLPYGIDERKRALQKIAVGAETYAAELGLSAGDVDRIKAIAVEYAFAATIYERNRQTLLALRTWRDAVGSNKASSQLIEERPMFDNTPMPAGTQRGLIAEIRRYVGRIKASAGFNSMIGEMMGVLSPNHAKKSVNDLQPKLKVTAVQGFNVKIACEMEGMTGLQIEYRRNGEEKFEKIAFLTKLPETIYIEPRVLGVPETGQMRASFFHKNKIVGKYSNCPTITIFGA